MPRPEGDKGGLVTGLCTARLRLRTPRGRMALQGQPQEMPALLGLLGQGRGCRWTSPSLRPRARPWDRGRPRPPPEASPGRQAVEEGTPGLLVLPPAGASLPLRPAGRQRPAELRCHRKVTQSRPGAWLLLTTGVGLPIAGCSRQGAVTRTRHRLRRVRRVWATVDRLLGTARAPLRQLRGRAPGLPGGRQLFSRGQHDSEPVSAAGWKSVRTPMAACSRHSREGWPLLGAVSVPGTGPLSQHQLLPARKGAVLPSHFTGGTRHR